MDLTPYLPWLKFIHIAGAIAFVAGHGVSMFMALRLRSEREPTRMLAMLDLSADSLGLATIGLLALLVAGIVDGIVAGYFGRLWIWIALVGLIAIGGWMTPMAAIHFNGIRVALGQRPRRAKPGDPDPVPRPIEEVVALASSNRPQQLAIVGGGGLLVILWLMTFKPF
jgi:hypothetical protein